MANKPMTGTRAASMLADILKWRLRPWTPIEQVSAIRYDTDPVQGGGEQGLPFRLDNAHDTSWEDGPAGVIDDEGVDTWLSFWNPWMSYWSNQPSIFRERPGPFFLQQLEENPAFSNVENWDDDDQTAWADFTSELSILWHKIGNLSGYAPAKVGQCPNCGHQLTAKMLDIRNKGLPDQHGGRSNTAECMKCESSWETTYELESAWRRTMQNWNDPEATVSLKQLKMIWPNLNAATLRKWVQRKQITRTSGQYSLVEVRAKIAKLC